MDPNRALENMRKAVLCYCEADAERYSATTNAGAQQAELDAHRAADDMAAAWQSLEEWFSKDGFLPDDWRELV
jgi:hypothetical protein